MSKINEQEIKERFIDILFEMKSSMLNPTLEELNPTLKYLDYFSYREKILILEYSYESNCFPSNLTEGILDNIKIDMNLYFKLNTQSEIDQDLLFKYSNKETQEYIIKHPTKKLNFKNIDNVYLNDDSYQNKRVEKNINIKNHILNKAIDQSLRYIDNKTLYMTNPLLDLSNDVHMIYREHIVKNPHININELLKNLRHYEYLAFLEHPRTSLENFISIIHSIQREYINEELLANNENFLYNKILSKDVQYIQENEKTYMDYFYTHKTLLNEGILCILPEITNNDYSFSEKFIISIIDTFENIENPKFDEFFKKFELENLKSHMIENNLEMIF